MPYFDSFDGVTLHYSDDGVGRPVVLLHGMGSDAQANFEQTGITRVLRDASYRVVALDIRGHGDSEPVSDPERFADDAMRRDVTALLDHLDVEESIVVGYSMSGFTTLRLAAHEPRVVGIVVIGIGENTGKIDGPPEKRAPFVEMLEQADPNDERTPPEFRVPAAQRAAIIAYMKAPWPQTRDVLDEIHVPALLIAGEQDRNAGDPTLLAGEIGGRVARVPGNHFTSLGEPALQRALVDFVGEI
jgi:pimeloyl-ACP methyl ester carboxylesterase